LRLLLKQVIESKRAEGYIEVVVGVFCSVLLLVFIINAFTFIVLKQNMDFYTKELLKQATIDGQISTNVVNRQNQLTAETGITPTTVTWNTTYFNASQRTVQFGEKIELTITYKTTFKGFGIFEIPVTLTARHSALSQRYHK
jgi:hypothetical protein